MRLPGEQEWFLGICTKQCAPRSCDVLCGNKKYRGNRHQLRTTSDECVLPNISASIYKDQAAHLSPLQTVRGQRQSGLFTNKDSARVPVPQDSVLRSVVKSSDNPPILRRSTRLVKPSDSPPILSTRDKRIPDQFQI